MKRIGLWVLCGALFLASSLFTELPRIVAQKSKTEDQSPILNLSERQIIDAKREAKSRRYDRAKAESITELPDDVQALPINNHWWKGLSSLPIDVSNVIVVGSVVDAKAYLSSDRTTVYSEFSVRLREVLKNTSGPAISVGDTILVERLGGSVKFPSGKVQSYRVSRQNFLKNNEDYVLFLKHNGDGYDVVTGYQATRGVITPLDGDDSLPFKKYEGKTVDLLLGELRNAISAASGKGGEDK